jgi:hypothetical protein
MEQQQASLVAFVVEQVRGGVNKKTIKEQLLSVGWSEEDADAAYAQALRETGIPIPEGVSSKGFTKKATTLEVVMNLFSFILLGVISFSLGRLYFEIIDKYFPDVIADNVSKSHTASYASQVSTDAVHYAIAALIVAFPLFFFVIQRWFQSFRNEEGKVESKLTKWVTYLVLLVASVTIVGSLIAALFSFLQGELSLRFFFKTLTVLVISGGVFGFYFLERKKVQYQSDIAPKIFQSYGLGVLAIILIGIILGFLAAGSPQMERMRTLDEKRSSDLSSLSSCISTYASRYKELPKNLSDLTSSSLCNFSSFIDPETQEEYEYRILSESEDLGTTRRGSYELCANFSLASDDTIQTRRYSSTSIWYDHETGRSCDTQITTWEVRGE